MSKSERRLIFDLSSSALWTGPSVGILRAQRELASWARHNAPATVFAVFDPKSGRHARISPQFVDAFIDGTAGLDIWGLPDPTGRRERKRWLPAPVQSALRIRRTTLRVLERVRLLSRSLRLASIADRLQRRLMTDRNRPLMMNADGSRRSYMTPDIALVEQIAFSAGDVLICTGNGWGDCDIASVVRQKSESGFRLAVLCYDIAPILYPDCFKLEDVEVISAYWRDCFPAADLVVFNSKAAATDALSYCQSAGIGLGDVAVTPLGSDPAPMAAKPGAALPSGLEAGRYALFVSTVEPRKGHEMLYRVWLRLLAEGIPQAHRFKLVFVGRVGWRMEALERALVSDERLAGSLVRLLGVGDETLDLLYRDAAFCLYPSLYEGYGLPIVEAFARGKALLASNGGSLAEVVGEFSPVLPTRDEDAWHELMKDWIENPTAYAGYEQLIRERLRHPSWDEAARRFFAIVADTFEANEKEGFFKSTEGGPHSSTESATPA
jgi:glycosyltransferase involved in cell wall biosynthesis